MRHLFRLFTFFLLTTAQPLSAQTLTGTVTDPGGMPVANARVTIFLNDTSNFHETRTDANGVYLFENLDPAYFFFGVAKPGFAYFNNATTGILGTVIHDAQLEPETESGQWDIIMQSPEALGGTDLGVLMPDGSIYYCHNTKDPFFFLPSENDTSLAKGSNIAQGCVAPALLLNGRVLFAGGTLEEDGFGPACKKIKTFDPATGLWVYQPDMLDERWYPTLAPLYDERLLIAGGGDENTGGSNAMRTNTSEVYDPATGMTQWADTVKFGNEVPAILPTDSLRLMPGWYMLFGMVDDIPSVAQIVKIEAGQFVSGTHVAPATESAFRVFPNPANAGSSLSAEMDLKQAGTVSFTLQDATGKVVRAYSFSGNTAGNQSFTLKTAGVPTGIYFLTASLEQALLGTEKIVLK